MLCRFAVPIRYLLLAFICLALAVVPQTVTATTSLYVSDARQARLSTAVVVASVGASSVHATENPRAAVTMTQIHVEEVLYGYAPPLLSLNQYGGVLGGQRFGIAGDASLEEGERCVLFLLQQDGQWYLTALEQSKYRLIQDPGSGLVLQRSLSSRVVYRGADGTLQPYQEPGMVKSLAVFRKKMHRLQEPGPPQ